MAAVLARKSSGLLRQLSVSICARTPFVPNPSSSVYPRPNFSTVAAAVRAPLCGAVSQTARYNILQRVLPIVPSLTWQPCRSLIYHSIRSGKRKTVASVPERFFRLHCGLWIRRKAGYKKKLWKKDKRRKKRLREIVFCNKTQCKLLDKMTSPYWKRRNWFVDDPYLKYHDRVNLDV